MGLLPKKERKQWKCEKERRKGRASKNGEKLERGNKLGRKVKVRNKTQEKRVGGGRNQSSKDVCEP